jgi:hypothetical protein
MFWTTYLTHPEEDRKHKYCENKHDSAAPVKTAD